MEDKFVRKSRGFGSSKETKNEGMAKNEQHMTCKVYLHYIYQIIWGKKKKNHTHVHYNKEKKYVYICSM